MAICCLENIFTKPEIGLSRLNWGVMGLALRIHPPAAIALISAAPLVNAAKAVLATKPTITMFCRRLSIVPGVITVEASNASCWPIASSS
ncbi:hypothetical protein D3C71_2007600 [compost metagenome]